MEIKICCYTTQEYLDYTGVTMEDVIEWYGEGVVRLYWAEAQEMTGGFGGVEYEDGHYAVYGCRLDEEHITFGRMLERIMREFMPR